MKLKTAIVTTALLLSASLAAADPVVQSFSNAWAPETGPFDLSFSFTVGQGADFDGSLVARSGGLGNIDLSSLLLTNGSTQYLYEPQNGSFASVVTGQAVVTTIKKHAITNYVDTYSFAPVFLAAGDWTATVVGSEGNSKLGGTLTLDLIDPPNDVPEPASLALAAVALGALGAARRRSRR